MPDPFAEAVQNERDRTSRSTFIENQRFGADYQERIATPNQAPPDSNGYWNGGGYTLFFKLGTSALDGPDILD